MAAVTVDPYTAEARLCDEDGIVRRGIMWHGTDYACTGSAHPGCGEHIRCTNPRHVSWFYYVPTHAAVGGGQTVQYSTVLSAVTRPGYCPHCGRR